MTIRSSTFTAPHDLGRRIGRQLEVCLDGPSFEGHTHHVLGAAWRFDGKVLSSCGADNVIKVWNFETGDQLQTMQGYAKQVTSISFIGETPNTLSSGGATTPLTCRVYPGGWLVRRESLLRNYPAARTAGINRINRINPAAGKVNGVGCHGSVSRADWR